MAEPLITLEHVSRIHQGVITALNDVSLLIAAREMVALLGPSGSGKSTLLSLIAALDSPDMETVLIAGRPVDEVPKSELLTRWIGMLFQQCHLLENLSPLENIVYFRQACVTT